MIIKGGDGSSYIFHVMSIFGKNWNELPQIYVLRTIFTKKMLLLSDDAKEAHWNKEKWNTHLIVGLYCMTVAIIAEKIQTC